MRKVNIPLVFGSQLFAAQSLYVVAETAFLLFAQNIEDKVFATTW